MNKVYIKDIEQNKCPCRDCNAGWGNISCGSDEKGEYIISETCQDHCKKYKEYINNDKQI